MAYSNGLTHDELEAALSAAEEYSKLNTPVGIAPFEENLDPVLKSKLPTSLTADDLPNERDLFNPLYHSMQKELVDVKAGQTKIDAIDPDVPNSIKHQRKVAILADLTASVEKNMMEPLADLDQKLSVMETNLIPTKPEQSEAKELLSEIKAQEIRTQLQGLESGEMARQIFQAAKLGRKDVLEAVQNAPFPIASDDLINRMNEIYTEEHLPDLLTARARNAKIKEKAAGKVYGLLHAIKNLV